MMFRKTASGLCAFIACLGFAHAASAATYNILADVSAAFDTGMTPILGWSATPSGPASAIDVEGPANSVFQVDFYLQSSGYVAGERGFGLAVFDFSLTNLTNTTSPDWVPDTTTVSDGVGTVPLWDENEDFAALDLLDILVSLAAQIANPNPGDERFTATFIETVAVPVPTFIGSLFVDYSGGSASLGANLTTTGHINDADGALVEDTGTSTLVNAIVNFSELSFSQADFNEDGFVDGADFSFFLGEWNPAPPGLARVPEPTSIALLGLAACGLAIRRRHS